MEEQEIKEQIKDKKAELFDIFIQIGIWEMLKQQKLDELKRLQLQIEKKENPT